MTEQRPQQTSKPHEQITKPGTHRENTARKAGSYILALGVTLAIGTGVAEAASKHKANEKYLSARAKTNRFLDAKSIIMATDILKLYAAKSPSEISYNRKLSSTMEEVEIDITSTAAPGYKAPPHPVWRLMTVFKTNPEGQLNPDDIHAINLQTENSEDCLIKGPDSRIRGFRPTANSFSIVGYNNANLHSSLVVASDDPKPKEQFMTLADAEAAAKTDLNFIQSAMRHAPVRYIPIPFQPKPGVVNPVVLG